MEDRGVHSWEETQTEYNVTDFKLVTPQRYPYCSFEELLGANMIQTDAATQLLIEKEIITEEEFYAEPKKGTGG